MRKPKPARALQIMNSWANAIGFSKAIDKGTVKAMIRKTIHVIAPIIASFPEICNVFFGSSRIFFG